MLLRTSSTRHNDHFSIIKAIAMLLVLYMHSGGNVGIHTISMVALPTFFITSGLCFKDAYQEQRGRFTVRRLMSLYLPFVKWSLVFLVLHNALHAMGLYAATIPAYSLTDMLHQLPHIAMMHTTDEMVGGYWFVTELFFASLIFIALLPLIARRPLLWSVLFLAVAMVMAWQGWHLRVRATTFVATSCYTLGYWLRGRELGHHRGIIAATGAVAILTSLIVQGHINKLHAAYLPLMAVVMIAGWWCIAAIAWHLHRSNSLVSRALSYMGRRTFIVLTLHMVSIRLFSWMLMHCGFTMPNGITSQPPLWLLPIYIFIGATMPLVYDFAAQRLKHRLKGLCSKHS